MKNKVLMKALKGATTPEEMIELINDFKEDTTVEVKKEVVKEEIKEKVVVEDKKEVIVEDNKIEKVVDNKGDSEVEKLIARVKQLEENEKEQDDKMTKWEELANTLAKDKPFGIVNKVQKREVTQTMYDQYDADLIIGK